MAPLINEGLFAFHPPKLRSYWTEVHHDVGIESFEIGIAIFHFFLECQGENKGEYVDFADFDAIMVAMTTFLERSDKRCQISNTRSNIYHTVVWDWK